MIGRRDISALLFGAAAWPGMAWAQQPKPLLGFLSGGSADGDLESMPGMRRGLAEVGYAEGRNLDVQYRHADGDYDRLPALAAELLAQKVSVLLARSLPAAVAAKAATNTVPIVFVIGADAVTQGLVASLARPGGNITGVTQLYGAVGGKRLELLRDLIPGLAAVAMLSNPDNPNTQNHVDEVLKSARAMNIRIDVVSADQPEDIEPAFHKLRDLRLGGILIADDPLFRAQRAQIVALAAQGAIPAVHFGRDFVLAGGLLSYGSSARENMRLAGGYVGRIISGAQPGELPVLQPTVFELVINLKAATALGLTVPPTLLSRADEVIE